MKISARRLGDSFIEIANTDEGKRYYQCVQPGVGYEWGDDSNYDGEVSVMAQEMRGLRIYIAAGSNDNNGGRVKYGIVFLPIYRCQLRKPVTPSLF